MTEPSTTRTGGADAHLDDESLSAYLDTELRRDELSKARRHLETCLPCRDRLEALSRTTELIGRRLEAVPSATRQEHLERALEASSPSRRAGCSPRARRRPAIASWAAALLVVIGGGALLWSFHPGFTGSSSTSASSRLANRQLSAGAGAGSSGTPQKAVAGTAAGGTSYGASGEPQAGSSAGTPPENAPELQLRVLEGLLHASCSPPSSTRMAAPVNATALFDSSSAASSDAHRCARVGPVILSLDRFTGARVLPTSEGPFESLSVSVPARAARGARSLLLENPGGAIAAVVGGEVVGDVSAEQASGHSVTIVRVPRRLAHELAREFTG